MGRGDMISRRREKGGRERIYGKEGIRQLLGAKRNSGGTGLFRGKKGRLPD